MDDKTINSKKSFFSDKMAQIIVFVFLIVLGWWIFINPFNSGIKIDIKNIWSSTYMVISILGGIFGLVISNRWGGYKSMLGRSIMAFSIGLLLQSFGQIIYNYYTLVANIQAPYPSLGDLGYFGSIPAYIYGVVLLGHVSGLKSSFSALGNKIFLLVLPIIMLVISYLIFLKDYTFDWTQPLKVFLDFGYPLGQAIYVSIALSVLIVSRNFLGGIMKKPVLFILLSLVVQYVCDFDFLYKANHNVWYAGGPGDFLYAFSYLCMTLSLLYIGYTFQKIKES